MKQTIIILIIFIGVLFALFSTTSFKQSKVVVQNNISKQAIEIKPDQHSDRYCNMPIKEIDYSGQAILTNGDTLFFDDIGCMVLWLEEQKNNEQIILWIWAKDTNEYINAREAWYHLGENTPMHYGFGAYKKHQANRIDFKECKLKILRGETMKNPKIKGEILGNN